MSVPKVFLIIAVGLFLFIGVLGWTKKHNENNTIPVAVAEVQELEFNDNNQPVAISTQILHTPIVSRDAQATLETLSDKDLPTANYIESFFDPAALKLPIVETVTYTSRAPWMKGKAAWVSDYATYYKTSKHFIARSLNRKADYFNQNVKNGDRFNVLRTDKDFYFYLLVDLHRCKMWFYYIDNETQDRVLLRTYDVGLGRPDEMKASGYLTPTGKYALGEKVAVYRPGIMGFHKNEPAEMVKVFGTRWMPFEKEIEGCSAPARGLGIHGNPLVYDNQFGKWVEDSSGIKNYVGDGCVRMPQVEVEELFSIIVSRPTVIELVHDFYDAQLPGKEKKLTK
jgi:hypothetical protein